MKKRNVILHTAIASALLAMGFSAQASGTLTATAINFATQNFGATAPATLGITPGPITYTFNTPGGIVVNPTGAIIMYFRLGNGATFAAAPGTGAFTGSITTLTPIPLTPTATAISTDKTTIAVTFTNSGGANATIGVGASVIFTPAAASVVGVNTTLATVGGVVSASASVSALAVAVNSVALPADLDGPAATAASIATAASAITGAVTAGGPTPETQKIDVTATPSQAFLTLGANGQGTAKVNFGSFKFTNVALVKNTGGTVDYSIAANLAATGTGAVATGSFSSAGAMTLTTDAACATALGAGSAGVLNAGKTTATWTAATTAATTVPTYVCMTANGTTAIPVTTPTLTVTTTPTTGTDAVTGTSGTLYALGLNGASIDVRSYVPAAAIGYSSFVRIVNTGSTAAPVSVAVIDQATGVAGSSAVLGTLAAGAAKTYLASDIEGAIGSIAAGLRPRLRITAPTAALQVQSFMSSPSGVFSDMSGGQLSNPAPATAITGN